MAVVSPGWNSLSSDLQSELREEKEGNTLLLPQHVIHIDLVSIQAKQFALGSFIFLHRLIPEEGKSQMFFVKF